MGEARQWASSFMDRDAALLERELIAEDAAEAYEEASLLSRLLRFLL